MARPVNPDTGRYHLVAKPKQIRRWVAAAQADKRSLAAWIAIALDAAAETAAETRASAKSTAAQKKPARTP